MPDFSTTWISKDIFLGPRSLAWDEQRLTQEREIPVSSASPHGHGGPPAPSTVEGAPGAGAGAWELVLVAFAC